MNGAHENVYKMGRKYAGLTQEQAAELLNVSVKSVSDYEGERTKVPEDVVIAMAKVYGHPALVWIHLQEYTRFGDFLPKIQLPQTNGEAGFAIWQAQNALVAAALPIMEILGEDICEDKAEELKIKMTKIEDVLSKLLSTSLFSKKLVIT